MTVSGLLNLSGGPSRLTCAHGLLRSNPSSLKDNEKTLPPLVLGAYAEVPSLCIAAAAPVPHE